MTFQCYFEDSIVRHDDISTSSALKLDVLISKVFPSCSSMRLFVVLSIITLRGM